MTRVYRGRYEWWYLVELCRRFLLIVIVVSTPGTPVSGNMAALEGLHTMHLLLHDIVVVCQEVTMC